MADFLRFKIVGMLRNQRERRIKAYKRELAEGAVDVAYSRVLFLGTAGVGKTSFKRSLMKLPWESNTTSTVVSDISQVRPFTHEWHTLKEDQWRVVSHEDEIEELAGLILAVYKKELEGSDATTYAHDESSQSLPQTPRNIILEVEKIISNALSYIDENPTLPLKPQPFFNFWDCGGQLPLLEILPVFLTSRTLFFLIFDAEKDLKSNWKSVINIEGESLDQEEVPTTTLDYMLSWMANIHGHLMSYDDEGGICDFPRMYCIGTHGDRVMSSKSEIERELKQHYQGKDFRALIEDTVIIDNTTSGQGEDEDPSLQALREAIVRFTEEKLVVKTPLSWILFRKVIQVLSKKYNVISLNDAHIIGAASKIPVEDMHHVLVFYHELGVLLFYPQIDGMKDKVVLNPKYIVDALGELFPSSVNPDRGRYCKEWKLFHECGILVQPLYVNLWAKYRDISPEILIKVLVHFRIAVEVKMDIYSPPSKQYFMPLVLNSTQVNSSSMTLPSDIIQAAPLHITFNSGYVPPGFFTRFVVVLASKIELCFEKGVYRNHVTLRYQDPNSTSIEHVVVTDCTDVIQINVQHHHLDHELVSFTKICQDIHGYLEDAAKEVEELLMKCASGGTTNNKSTQYVFKHKFKYVCTSCPTTTPLHYITLPPTTSTQDSQVFCDENMNDYRVLTEQEKVWFKDTSQSTPATQMPPTATAKSPKRNNSKRRIEKGVHSHGSDVKLLNISDLDYVIEELQSIDYNEWKTLGVHLGLYHTTLEAIKADHRSVKKCLMECMAVWLKEEDKVREKGGPSWLSLARALEKIGANNTASNIRAKTMLMSMTKATESDSLSISTDTHIPDALQSLETVKESESSDAPYEKDIYDIRKPQKDYEELKFSNNELHAKKFEEKTQLEEEKQIITEDYEKLKAKVDEYEVYITEIEEEKKQVEEEKKQIEEGKRKVEKEKEQVEEDKRELEEHYLKEKQITKELKTKVADNELYTAKLMKEKSQLQEKVTSLEEQSIKETSSIGPQFNYLEKEQEEKCISVKKLHKENKHIASFSRYYCMLPIYLLFISFILCTYYNSKHYIAPLPGIVIIASTNLLVAGGSTTQLHWEEYGLILDVPPDALPRGFIAKITVRVSISGPYVYPDSDTWKPASAVYWISSSKDFVNPVLLGIQHSLRGSVKLSEIKVLTADDTATQNMSYVFQNLYSNFTLNGPYVYLLLNHFSATEVVADSTCTEISFYGSLYWKKGKGKYLWDYSYVVYQGSPTGITNKLLDDYKYWEREIVETDVIFEDNSTAITLNLPSNQNWDITGKTSPLIYYKDYIKRDRIQSNMQFRLLWKGQGHPTTESIVLHLSGTVHPDSFSLVTNSIEDEDKNHVVPEKQLDTTNLKQIILALKGSKYEVGTWHNLCLHLGLDEAILNTIEKEKNDSEDGLRICLNKWLQRVNDAVAPTWTSLEQALNNIGQKAVAESLKNN